MISPWVLQLLDNGILPERIHVDVPRGGINFRTKRFKSILYSHFYGKMDLVQMEFLLYSAFYLNPGKK